MKISLESFSNTKVYILTEAQQIQIKGGTTTTTTTTTTLSGDKRTPRPGSGTTSKVSTTGI